ncbi:uncharacterized protein [Zea mays]|uniref:Uncharacterized protein n=2 Tax=Zea mays TaxID=4577 RepID=A0A1D6NI10_MAIZE|nr:uncharacterized protein LOC100192780 [Zea mays]XP_020405041.2 uncharacterized protein LOC100192780 isoform X4 [Zea mays]ONM40021.1 hypothetical protein ZEAMMB73_Zm00001d044133 [Zea mays]|eukprot:NP_001345481.1 uncharacterized protein LOC100192780 [Zea mays]
MLTARILPSQVSSYSLSLALSLFLSPPLPRKEPVIRRAGVVTFIYIRHGRRESTALLYTSSSCGSCPHRIARCWGFACIGFLWRRNGSEAARPLGGLPSCRRRRRCPLWRNRAADSRGGGWSEPAQAAGHRLGVQAVVPHGCHHADVSLRRRPGLQAVLLHVPVAGDRERRCRCRCRCRRWWCSCRQWRGRRDVVRGQPERQPDRAAGRAGLRLRLRRGLLRDPAGRELLQPGHRPRPRVLRLQQLLPEEPRPDQLRLRRHGHHHQHRSQFRVVPVPIIKRRRRRSEHGAPAIPDDDHAADSPQYRPDDPDADGAGHRYPGLRAVPARLQRLNFPSRLRIDVSPGLQRRQRRRREGEAAGRRGAGADASVRRRRDSVAARLQMRARGARWRLYRAVSGETYVTWRAPYVVAG